MKTTLTLIAAPALVGCSQPNWHLVHGDLNFTEPERAAIERAAETLRTQTGVSFDIVWDGQRKDSYIVRETGTPSGGRCGETQVGGGFMHLWTTLPEWNARCALHEFIHLAGVKGHSETGLMSPYLQAKQACIEPASFEYVARYIHVEGEPCAG